MNCPPVGWMFFLGASMVAAIGSPSWAAEIATPSGLSPGASFRFAFVTSTVTTAASTDINFYNNLVSTDAAGYTYGGQAITWKAIGSTATVDARDNIGGFGTITPVYLVNGTKIANDLTTFPGGLWGFSLLAPLNRQIDGTLPNSPPGSTAERVWTGTWLNGQALVPPLGDPGPRYGRYDEAGDGWISYLTQGNDETSRLYGISPTLTAVPEPSTCAMALAGIACGGYSMFRRRNRA